MNQKEAQTAAPENSFDWAEAEENLKRFREMIGMIRKYSPRKEALALPKKGRWTDPETLLREPQSRKKTPNANPRIGFASLGN